MQHLRLVHCALGSALLLYVGVATAEVSPVQVHARTTPALGIIELIDTAGATIDQRSAVRVAGRQFVTVCEGLDEAATIKITVVAGTFDAHLVARDAPRNLCLIKAPSSMPEASPIVVRRAPAPPGSRVFAVSNALGLGLGISDGLVSGVRTFSAGSYIQFSAPISPGSQGGALVDGDGHLVGIIEYRHRSGQNVNFATPATWIGEIEARSNAQRSANQQDEHAAALVREGRWSELAAVAKRWRDENPESALAWRYIARVAEHLGQSAQAVEAWQMLARLEPDAKHGKMGLINATLGMGNTDQALTLAESLLAHDREDAAVWLLYGRALQASRRNADAEAAYRRTAELDPWQLDAYVALAQLAQSRGDFPASVAILTRLSGIFPNVAAFRYDLIRAQLLAGEPEHAYLALTQLPESEAGSAAASYWRGMTLRKLGRPVDAVAALRESIAKDLPEMAQAWIALSSALAELLRHPEAIEAARNAVKIDPDNADSQFWLAVRLKDGGRAAEALPLSAALTSAYPRDAAAWRLHGFTLALLGQQKAAIDALEKSLAIDSRQARVWAALAEVRHAAGQEQGARQAYEQLRTVDPDQAESLYRGLIVGYEEHAQ